MPTPRLALCAVYGAIALIALIATWSQNLAYFPIDPMGFVGAFLSDTKVNPASRSITVDIILFFLAASVFMVIEARKHAIPFVWAYIVAGVFIAISVTFPLFLIARELRLASPDGAHLRTFDLIPLALFAALMLGLSYWLLAI